MNADLYLGLSEIQSQNNRVSLNLFTKKLWFGRATCISSCLPIFIADI